MKSLRLKGDHFLFAAERFNGRARFNLKVRDPRRPHTISFNIARYAPDRKRSF